MATTEEILEELLNVEVELQDVQDQIKILLDRQGKLYERQSELKALFEDSEASGCPWDDGTAVTENWSETFEWDSQADDVRFNIYGIPEYRANQREFGNEEKQEFKGKRESKPLPLQWDLFWFQVSIIATTCHQIINAIMSARDVLVIMAAGGGKSLCYQLPAILRDGVALVVSPLLSLIQDQLLQVMGLPALGVPAFMLTSTTSKEDEKFIYKALEKGEGELKILYVTPEKISKSKRFMSKLEKCHHAGRLSLIAIDEAHCCSQWGHDFRPDYKNLGILKTQFPSVPLVALTATATKKVQADLIEMLHIPKCIKFVSTVNRPNLYYMVRVKSSVGKMVIDEIAEFIVSSYPNKESGIVYCFSRKECEQVAKELRERGISADYYHADMDINAREKVHQRWSNSKLQVIVGTVAFGMGINKPDGSGFQEADWGRRVGDLYLLEHLHLPIKPSPTTASSFCLDHKSSPFYLWHFRLGHLSSERLKLLVKSGHLGIFLLVIFQNAVVLLSVVRFVIHHSLSKSMETYYQESGRAGRDGLPSECLLFFRPGDVPRQSSIVFYENSGLQNLYDIVRYCQTRRECRRSAFFRHFAEPLQDCNGMCDNCSFSAEVKEMDVSGHAKSLLSVVHDVQENDQRLTMLQLVDKMKVKNKGVGPEMKKDELEQLVIQLILDRVLIRGERIYSLIGFTLGHTNEENAPMPIIDFSYEKQHSTSGKRSFLRKEEFQHTAYSTNAYVTIGPLAKQVLQGKKIVMLEVSSKQKGGVMKGSKRSLASSGLVYKLDELRKELSSGHGGIFPHSVLSTQQITLLSTERPKTMEQVEKIIGKLKAQKYGSKILEEIQNYELQHPLPSDLVDEGQDGGNRSKKRSKTKNAPVVIESSEDEA
ncbi:hypothetical protein RHGRI_020972 [Rhododendron griersonianum]|uniref:ATP-dependent DNA helicase n=2 Tax=Rhododendron griersonianum TaxID=479676 RepID=A0AAV6JMP2_9ERIC|nr:hypothetical protein RHGRI_020972 [Rhododendron griersonianum]